MISSTALNSHGNNIPCFLFSLILGLLLILLNHHCFLMLKLVLDLSHKHGFSFFSCQAGNTLQLSFLLFVHFVNSSLALIKLCLLGRKNLFLFFQGFEFSIQVFFLRNKTTLLTLKVITAILGFLVQLLAQTMYILLRLKKLFLLGCLASILCCLDDALSFFLSGTNLLFSS